MRAFQSGGRVGDGRPAFKQFERLAERRTGRTCRVLICGWFGFSDDVCGRTLVVTVPRNPLQKTFRVVLALLATAGSSPAAIAALGIAYVGCLVASAGLARLSLRRTRYAYDEGFIYLAGGLLSFDVWIVPRERVQGVVLEQSLFQRRRALASLAIDVNGLPRSAALMIPNIALERASALLDRFSNPARRRAR